MELLHVTAPHANQFAQFQPGFFHKLHADNINIGLRSYLLQLIRSSIPCSNRLTACIQLHAEYGVSRGKWANDEAAAGLFEVQQHSRDAVGAHGDGELSCAGV